MSHTHRCEFSSAFAYIETAADIEAKIEKINQIQTALEDAALNSASRNGIEEYMLDDGQVKIKTIYRSVDEIVASIEGFEKIKQRLINRVQGHVMQLRPNHHKHC